MAVSDVSPPTSYLRGGKLVIPFDVEQRQVTDPQTGQVRIEYEYQEYEIAANATEEQVIAARNRAERKSQAGRNFKLLDAIAGQTDQQIIDYINSNVTDLASAKAILRLLARAVGMLARNTDIED